MRRVLIVRGGEDEANEAEARLSTDALAEWETILLREAKRRKLRVVRKAASEAVFDRALVVAAGTAVPWGMVEHGFHFVERWDAACPLWRYDVTAGEIGTAEERRRTEALTLDLRIPVYACELLWVGTTAPKGVEPLGRRLLEAWEEELTPSPGPSPGSGEGSETSAGDERLAFLRAVARVKPRLCTLPAEWLGVERKRRERSRGRGLGAGAPRKTRKPQGLVRVEIGPGRFVLARPENVERVRADFERRGRRRGR